MQNMINALGQLSFSWNKNILDKAQHCQWLSDTFQINCRRFSKHHEEHTQLP